MCGIGGFISKNASLGEHSLRHFTTMLTHRGPDASGFIYEEFVGLAHNRLSILDTSCNANQPFTSANNRFVVVFNGEIYNYKELQKKIKVPLKTTSDTEVLAELFAAEGERSVEQWRGMFAAAIYDKEQKELWLVRDRLGIKPLYYYLDNENFIFSSELKALASLPEIKSKLTIDREAIQHFLHLGFVPSEYSLYSQIKKFPSAHIAKIDIKLNLKKHNYWNITSFGPSQAPTFEKAKQTVKELLFASVQEHLVSDVPVGLYLSGGIDSSLLAAISSQLYPGKLKTFTLGFKKSRDEAPWAKQIAEYLQTDHLEYYMEDNDAIRLSKKLQETYDEPFADTSAIPTLFISEKASKHVKVVLSGEGADELFLGYNTHNWANRIRKPYFSIVPSIIKLITAFSNDSKLKKVQNIVKRLNTPYEAANLFSVEHSFFGNVEVADLTGKSYKGYAYEKAKDQLENLLLFELEVALQDGLLVKMDRASMQYGLEARVPYLDHRIVEYTLSLDHKFKLKPNKLLLKEILFEFIPHTYFQREKWGFALSEKDGLGSYLKDQMLNKETKENKLQRIFALFALQEATR